MFSVPQRLLELDSVRCHIQQGEFLMLEKQISEAVTERKSYISQAALSFVLNGEQNIIGPKGDLQRVPAGNAIFLNQGLYTLSDFIPESGHFHNRIFFFPLAFIQSFVANYSKGPRVSGRDVYAFKSSPEFEAFAHNLQALQETRAHIPPALLEIKTHELLYLIQDHCKDEIFRGFLGRVARKPKRSLKSFMENHYDKSLRVEDFAQLTGRSLSTFRRDFQRIFQLSPNKWLKQKRLIRASELLIRTSFQVNEVAQESGFSTPSYFIAEFRKHFGETPLEYRERQA